MSSSRAQMVGETSVSPSGIAWQVSGQTPRVWPLVLVHDVVVVAMVMVVEDGGSGDAWWSEVERESYRESA